MAFMNLILGGNPGAMAGMAQQMSGGAMPSGQMPAGGMPG